MIEKHKRLSKNYQAPRLIPSLVILIVLFSASFVAAARRERLIENWKPLHYELAFTFNDQLSEISKARAELTVLILKDDLAHVDLDFGNMQVDSVKVDSEIAPFERVPGRLHVKLLKRIRPQTRLLIAIEYHGKPADGLILSIDKAGKPSAVGDNWPNRVHHWIPSLDHPSAKASVNFTVNAPEQNLVVANGKLEKIQASPNFRRTWYFKEKAALPPYCMIVAVGQFAKVDPAEQKQIPLSYYVPSTDKHLAVQGFGPSYPSLDLFSRQIAAYPYEKLDMIVGATRFGGMENSSAIVFSQNSLVPRPQEKISRTFKIREGLATLIAHEVAHQWFGDSVTGSTWADLWLSEGFATYFAGLFLLKFDGDQAFRDYMKSDSQEYFAYAKRKRTPLHDTETEDLFALLNANNYQKGSWILHMLRAELGDDAFYRGIRAYYNAHKHGIANSEDLRSALEKASRRNLKPFFASWVYGAGHPKYQLGWTWNRRTKRLKLELSQLQPEAAFPNTIEVDVAEGNRLRRVLLTPESKNALKEIRLSAAPSQVILDPDDDILDEGSSVAPNR